MQSHPVQSNESWSEELQITFASVCVGRRAPGLPAISQLGTNSLEYYQDLVYSNVVRYTSHRVGNFAWHLAIAKHAREVIHYNWLFMHVTVFNYTALCSWWDETTDLVTCILVWWSVLETEGTWTIETSSLVPRLSPHSDEKYEGRAWEQG